MNDEIFGEPVPPELMKASVLANLRQALVYAQALVRTDPAASSVALQVAIAIEHAQLLKISTAAAHRSYGEDK